jgi:hypothetical protein
MSNLSIARSTIFALSAVFLSGCATTTKPTVDYDPSVAFGAYRSFAFISDHPMIRGPTSRPASPLTEGRIVNDISNELEKKGFARKSDPESADFAISFTVGARDQISVTSYPEPYRGGYGAWGTGWGGRAYGGYGTGYSTDVRTYTEGALAIDFFDVKQHKPVWHALATKKITSSMEKNPGPVLDEIVAAMLAGFPPI